MRRPTIIAAYSGDWAIRMSSGRTTHLYGATSGGKPRTPGFCLSSFAFSFFFLPSDASAAGAGDSSPSAART